MLADQVVDDIAKNVIQTQLAQIQKAQRVETFFRLSRKVLRFLTQDIDVLVALILRGFHVEPHTYYGG